MRRFFNTAGPCAPDIHYMVPAAARLSNVRELVDSRSWFGVHAPRQTGKTTTLREIANELTSEAKYTALHFTCEEGAPAGDDYVQAQLAVLSAIERSARNALPLELRPPAWPSAPDLSLLGTALEAWALASPRPLVLFFDEIDALRGDSLMAVLRQLRAGYPSRPTAFPHSVVLCGLRDVRDYKHASGGDASRLGSQSPFNISVESQRLGDFTFEEACALYAQHTTETGQSFTSDALERAWTYAQGQPWLTNALAREVTENMGVPLFEPITADHIDEAKERLILARATHLDSLVDKLHEKRVHDVIAPILEGTIPSADAAYNDDLAYVRDLGLIAKSNPVRIANPIYREVIVRVLAEGTQALVQANPRSFVLRDGRFDMRKMLEEFAAFWREHGDVVTKNMPYHETSAQIVLMAFLQRVVNGGGYVSREYGIGRGRIDVLIRWPYGETQNRAVQVEAMELKVWRDKKRDPLDQGLVQLEEYLDRFGLRRGVLVLFDRRSDAPPIEDRVAFEAAVTPKGYEVTVLRG